MKQFLSFLYVFTCLIALNAEFDLGNKTGFFVYYIFWIANAVIAANICSKHLRNTIKQNK